MKAVTVAPGTAGSVRLEDVPEPDDVLGSVNANRRHYYRAAKVLAAADRSWLEQLVTRRVRPDQAPQALQREPDDIKVVMEFAQP
jgi:threonine dehydrogenase-like Zn-dependent dehydrogenase